MMKRIHRIWGRIGAVCLVLAMGLQGARGVTATTVQFCTDTLTGVTLNAPIRIVPSVNKLVVTNHLIYASPTITLAVAGGCGTTNLLPGPYDCTIQGVSQVFTIVVPATNSTVLQAADLVVTVYTNTLPPGLVAYPTSVSDARYQAIATNAPGAAGQVLTSDGTNGYFAAATSGGVSVAAGSGIVTATNGTLITVSNALSAAQFVASYYGYATNLSAAQLAVGGTPIDLFNNWPLQVVGTNYGGNLLAGWDNAGPGPVVALTTSSFLMTNSSASGVAFDSGGNFLLTGAVVGSLSFNVVGQLVLSGGAEIYGNGGGLTNLSVPAGSVTGLGSAANYGTNTFDLAGTAAAKATAATNGLGSAAFYPTNTFDLAGTAAAKATAATNVLGALAYQATNFVDRAGTASALVNAASNNLSAVLVATNDSRALNLPGNLTLGTANGLTVLNASNVVAGNINSPGLAGPYLVGSDAAGNLQTVPSYSPLSYNGSALQISAANTALPGTMSAADYNTLRTNVPRLNGTNTFAGTNVFGGITTFNNTVYFTNSFVYFTDNLDIGNGDNVYLTNGVYYGIGSGSFVAGATGGFTGNGSGLTNLPATAISSGTLPDARLSGPLFTSTGAATNNSTTATSVFTNTLAAAQLSAPGNHLHYILGGTNSSTSGTRSYAAFYGGSLAANFPGIAALASTSWAIEGDVWYVGATNQFCRAQLQIGNTLATGTYGYSATTGETSANALAFGVSLTGGATGAITNTFAELSYFPK